MSAARREREASPGWLATAGGAFLLVVLGFGIGLLAGAAFEEPGLVMDHLAGRTRELPLAEVPDGAAPPAATPDVAAPPPLGAASPVRGASNRSRPAAPPARTRPPAAGGFAVQVGAFSARDAARHLAAELRKLGLSAYVADEVSGGARYKVRVGPLATREEATELAQKLKTEHRLPTWVLAREGR